MDNFYKKGNLAKKLNIYNYQSIKKNNYGNECIQPETEPLCIE